MKYKSENGDTPQKVYYESENILYDVCDFYPKKVKGIDKTQYYDKTYTNCDMCEFKTKFPSNLKKHKITVHEKVKKLCQFCNKGFIYLKEHIDTMHSKSKLYVCKHCNFSSVKLSGLRSHMKRKHSEPRVKQTCPICFIKCFNIQIHVKRIHEDPVQQQEDFHCTTCPYKGTRINLKSHIKMVHNVTYTHCQVCNKEVNAYKITSHMKKHQENQFSCNPCNKTFSVMRDLARHVLYYHKNHRNKCEYCGKEVTSLKQHVKWLHKEVASPVDETKDLNLMSMIKAFLGENVSYNGELDIVTSEHQETDIIGDVDISEEDPLGETKDIPDEILYNDPYPVNM